MSKKQAETQIHFVGIGGIGMSGIATVLLNQGYRVSGSDASDGDSVRTLRERGAKVMIGHATENVQDADVVVISSAIRPENPEWMEAKRRRIPVIPRAEMLAELMRGKTGIAVAGTHGKTTTTSLLATVLTEAKLDPTLVIGGKVDSLGGNAKLGKGEYVVAEADESDGSFLHLTPTYGIITNIDSDHLDHFGNISAIEEAFVSFVSVLPFFGIAVVCAEDSGVARCLSRFSKPYVTYGWTAQWDYWAEILERTSHGTRFAVWCRDKVKAEVRCGEIHLPFPGQHNVLNALAATVVALKLGVDFEVIAKGLASFAGVKRRFETRWKDESTQRWILDDYGHHPTEVAATLEAARTAWTGRIISIFQPHRFTRTLHSRDGFLTAFRQSDVVLITDVYAAGETPIEGVSGASLADDIRKVAPLGQDVEHVGNLDQAAERLLSIFRPGDLLLCLGAGTITRLPDLLIPHLGVPSGAPLKGKS